MRASTTDSVLIEQVVYLASRARQATDQDPIFDMPKGRPRASSCPIARALNLKCSVNSSAITFPTAEQAALVAEAIGCTATGTRVDLRDGHPFRRFVQQFDQNGGKYLRALRLSS